MTRHEGESCCVFYASACSERRGCQTDVENKPARNQMKNRDEIKKWASVEYVLDVYGMPRSLLFKFINDGSIESRLLRHKGARALGRRLVSIPSVEAFIERAPVFSDDKVRERMSALGNASSVAKRAALLKARRRAANARKAAKR
jgi:hypothetical protein